MEYFSDALDGCNIQQFDRIVEQLMHCGTAHRQHKRGEREAVKVEIEARQENLVGRLSNRIGELQNLLSPIGMAWDGCKSCDGRHSALISPPSQEKNEYL